MSAEPGKPSILMGLAWGFGLPVFAGMAWNVAADTAGGKPRWAILVFFLFVAMLCRDELRKRKATADDRRAFRGDRTTPDGPQEAPNQPSAARASVGDNPAGDGCKETER